ncbi:DUF2500 domain-containing protein [Paenibacillus antarcticus]|uniref:DUF2500 domain-containing protein n=1 Tax=Paenibacillus antarcticus TaxID=253703 RepID=A0A168JTP4_9BACL|nr:DUF2500 domain-containing protein [Paenibacillus antarcticus]OAB41089.1 hypothetical protein PBAT_21225 [Paenibacillus antarcticus]
MGTDSFWMFDFIGTVMPIFIIVIIGILLLSAGKGILRWSSNNKQPQLTVGSSIVSKRNEVKQHQNYQNDQISSYTRTCYYITFEVDSGDRIEFVVNGEEYGLCAEGDTGQLTFQGTRYMGFQRNPRFTRQENAHSQRRGYD